MRAGKREWPWWCVSLVLALATAVTVWVVSWLPFGWGTVGIVLGVIVFMLSLAMNPKYWARRVASTVVGVFVASAWIPRGEFKAQGQNFYAWVVTENTDDWKFVAGAVMLVVTLLTYDLVIRFMERKENADVIAETEVGLSAKSEKSYGLARVSERAVAFLFASTQKRDRTLTAAVLGWSLFFAVAIVFMWHAGVVLWAAAISSLGALAEGRMLYITRPKEGEKIRRHLDSKRVVIAAFCLMFAAVCVGGFAYSAHTFFVQGEAIFVPPQSKPHKTLGHRVNRPEGYPKESGWEVSGEFDGSEFGRGVSRVTLRVCLDEDAAKHYELRYPRIDSDLPGFTDDDWAMGPGNDATAEVTVHRLITSGKYRLTVRMLPKKGSEELDKKRTVEDATGCIKVKAYPHQK